jgi:hypothetical protein
MNFRHDLVSFLLHIFGLLRLDWPCIAMRCLRYGVQVHIKLPGVGGIGLCDR